MKISASVLLKQENKAGNKSLEHNNEYDYGMLLTNVNTPICTSTLTTFLTDSETAMILTTGVVLR